MKDERILKKENVKRSTSGITLIALVVTIIVLLILAGVSIAMLSGDNSILRRAVDAREITKESQDEEKRKLLQMQALMPTEETVYNNVKIPKGFVVSDVEGENTVENGLVIIDADGNEFVWFPVESINNLSRRTFTESSSTLVNGDANCATYFLGEGTSGSCMYNPSDTQYSINAFITSVEENGGFFIGRYEAGITNERQSYAEDLQKPYVKKNLHPYTYVTRNQAMDLAQKMYKDNSTITSNIWNSYAFDTVLDFLCTKTEIGYRYATDGVLSIANVATEQIENTGMWKSSINVPEKIYNIFDFAGNVREWTTEHTTVSSKSCVIRGSFATNSTTPVGGRTARDVTENYFDVGFRVILYFK